MGIGETPTSVDVAIVSASHRDLEAMIDSGRLRRDLYARLAGHEITLPALSDRLEDLGLLVARILAEQGAPEASFTAEAALALAAYAWPHNVRELKAALVHAVALSKGEPIGKAELPRAIREGEADRARPRDLGAAAGVHNPRDAKVRQELIDLLKAHGGNVAAVAREMGKHRRQVQRWMERFELDPDAFRV